MVAAEEARLLETMLCRWLLLFVSVKVYTLNRTQAFVSCTTIYTTNVNISGENTCWMQEKLMLLVYYFIIFIEMKPLLYIKIC